MMGMVKAGSDDVAAVTQEGVGAFGWKYCGRVRL